MKLKKIVHQILKIAYQILMIWNHAVQ